MTELERLQQENAQLNRQVTDIQERCTELLEERRRANVDYAVREFHLKYGHPAPGRLTVPDDAMIRFRLKLVAEEFLELLTAAIDEQEYQWVGDALRENIRDIIEDAPIDIDLPEFMDATHDLDYVVAGTRVVFGYDGRPGAAEVHRANMDKEPNGLGKPTKPEGWRPPDIAGCLRAQGWVPPGTAVSSRDQEWPSPEDLRKMRLSDDWGTAPPAVFAEDAKKVSDGDTVSLKCEPWRDLDPKLVAAVAGPVAAHLITQAADKLVEDGLRAALRDFLSAWQVRSREAVQTSNEDALIAVFKNFGWGPHETRGDDTRREPFPQNFGSPKACEAEGCDALHPSACSADPSVDGWLCRKHYPITDETHLARVAAAGRFHSLLLTRPKLMQEAAKGLRKLAAKYPEMLADGECGEVGRGYYEHLAHRLDVWAAELK